MRTVIQRYFVVFVLLFLSVGVASAQLPDFVDLVDRNSPAVVNISTSQEMAASEQVPDMPDLPEGHPFRDFMDRFLDENTPPPGPRFDSQSLGSGFIVSDDGYILTNNHVVEGATEIIVRLNDRRQLVAELVGADKRSDLALLKVEGADLPTVSIGSSSDLKVGEWVLAIGAPFGFEYSVTAGIISAKGRNLPTESYVPFLQTDVAINPGNSGGPLFNLDGEVVGINSHIYSRSGGFQGISFAIPIELAMDVADQLKAGGVVSRAWLGVVIQDVTRELAESFGMDRPEGALVAQILPDSPAAAADFEPGDVIVEFNGVDVPNSGALPAIVGRAPVGDRVPVVVMRSGEEQVIEVVLEQLPEDLTARAPGGAQEQQRDRGEFASLGMTVEPLNQDAREALGLNEDAAGVLVSDVSGEPAREAGLMPGDVITRINRQEIESISALREVLDSVSSGRSIPLLVLRNGTPRFLALRIP